MLEGDIVPGEPLVAEKGSTRALALEDFKAPPTNGKSPRGLLGPFRALWRHRRVIYHLARQEIVTRYAATVIGFYWIVFLPVFYVTVFVLIRFLLLERAAGWEGAALGLSDLAATALAIGLGLAVFWQASEVIERAPRAVRGNASFVRDMAFPLEALPWISISTVVFHTAVRTLLLVIAVLVVAQTLPWTVVFLPLVLLPMLLIVTGLAYLLAALGVFLRDLDLIIGVLMTGMLLLSGVIFPLSRIPEPYQTWLLLNPIAFTIEQARQVVLWGILPNWHLLAIAMAAGVTVAWVGFTLFQRVRSRFADVL